MEMFSTYVSSWFRIRCLKIQVAAQLTILGIISNIIIEKISPRRVLKMHYCALKR